MVGTTSSDKDEGKSESCPALNHNGIMPVARAWMDRVNTVLSKGRPTEKDKLHNASLTGIFLKLTQM